MDRDGLSAQRQCISPTSNTQTNNGCIRGLLASGKFMCLNHRDFVTVVLRTAKTGGRLSAYKRTGAVYRVPERYCPKRS